ncbi:hypothetical protein [Cupriavidus necator]|uniref:hypothetical protein n=1 Tax=Cupriavidus necator TaxID=106590 RepID=UPI00339D522D
MDSLLTAVEGGSLLVTGEPGAGKTGILLTLAEHMAKGSGPLVFLSVERFSSFNKQSDFRTELNLDHDLIEVLAAWPGIEPGVLIVDALDASRGGPSEPVIAGFIADAVRKVGARWSIIASIRSFDLRNGQRFREIMPGAPPIASFVEEGMANVRHFRVPRLSSGELAAVSAASPSLSDLERTAPQKLRDLLRNVFNLSLAAELLDAGVEAQSIRTVGTQSELIERYEDIRLPSQTLQRAVKAAVTLMVRRRQLTVRSVDIDSDAVDEVRKAGVLVAAGDRVAFAHHVLFDHIAGRFYLSWDDTQALRGQLAGESSIGLLLGPALRFALERLWQDDATGRAATWRFLADLAALPKHDPVVISIALRTAAEQVENEADVDGLLAIIGTASSGDAVSRMLAQLARFAGMAIAEQKVLSGPASLAWAGVAIAAAKSADPYLSDAARVLLMTLADKADLSDIEVMAAFGEAARALLRSAWSLNPERPPLTTAGIRFVAKSYRSDPAASRALLERILSDRFDRHASQEAPWLAEGVSSIIPHDPGFVARIYETIFTRDVTDEGQTWVGGAASRILPLTSTHRQDYQHARWHLNQSLKTFLESDSAGGTAAVVGAARGLESERLHSLEERRQPTVIEIPGRPAVQVVDDYLSLQDWREEDVREEGPLKAFVEFLRSCPREAFRDAVATALELPTNAAVWARILGVAADHPAIAADLLWPLVSNPHFVALQGLARDAVIFLAAAYGTESLERREAFETLALAEGLFPSGRESSWWRSVIARFLSSIPSDQLATPEMQALRAQMEAAGDLIGNRPFMSMTFERGSEESIVDSVLRIGGADLERSPDREIRAASRKVEDRIRAGREKEGIVALASLWRDILELVEALDAGAATEPHPELVHASWGAVSNGVERIAESAAYIPKTDSLPDIDALLALIDRLSASSYPEASDPPSDQMSWGNWDVRVYAASSLVALAQRFGAERPDIVDRMQACLQDPVPTVRLQVAQALNVLWDVAHERMWALVTAVAISETHQGVLRFFIAGPMGRLSRKHPERCARLFSPMLERKWVQTTGDERTGRDSDAEVYANLTALLYVAHEQAEAWEWIERWAADLRRGEVYLNAILHSLRQVFFFPYNQAQKPEQLQMARRGRRLLDVVVGTSVLAIVEARPHLLGTPDGETVAVWRPLFIAAHRLIDQVCSQLYFGSGAFRPQANTDGELALQTAHAKQRFLADYGGVLDVIATHAQARTVHNLLELLAYLVEGGPANVFDKLAKVLLGPAAEDGYQFEPLGLDSLVKLVRRYLADHRDVFEDQGRRQELVHVLELFSSAGWPEALKLLFELPDLLR